MYISRPLLSNQVHDALAQVLMAPAEDRGWHHLAMMLNSSIENGDKHALDFFYSQACRQSRELRGKLLELLRRQGGAQVVQMDDDLALPVYLIGLPVFLRIDKAATAELKCVKFPRVERLARPFESALDLQLASLNLNEFPCDFVQLLNMSPQSMRVSGLNMLWDGVCPELKPKHLDLSGVAATPATKTRIGMVWPGVWRCDAGQEGTKMKLENVPFQTPDMANARLAAQDLIERYMLDEMGVICKADVFFPCLWPNLFSTYRMIDLSFRVEAAILENLPKGINHVSYSVKQSLFSIALHNGNGQALYHDQFILPDEVPAEIIRVLENVCARHHLVTVES